MFYVCVSRETLKAKQSGNSLNSRVSRVLLPLPDGPLITTGLMQEVMVDSSADVPPSPPAQGYTEYIIDIHNHNNKLFVTHQPPT